MKDKFLNKKCGNKISDSFIKIYQVGVHLPQCYVRSNRALNYKEYEIKWWYRKILPKYWEQIYLYVGIL